MKSFISAIKKNKTTIFIYLLLATVDFSVFFLYDIMMEPFVYSLVIGFFFVMVFIICDFFKARREENLREEIEKLKIEVERKTVEFEASRKDMLDYYTTWVHQIKTPIAVMRLKLSDDTPENAALLAELFRIEQYVEMVLHYVRLDAASNDLLIAEYNIGNIVTGVIKKYASQFIEKKIKLEYSDIAMLITTDSKWYSCIVEQILSNAIKYTPNGGTIAIVFENEKLYIKDNGIGIEPEDIPRIFEKGYTGVNGRIGEKSSGLGLYLANKAAKMLKLTIQVESTPSSGSTFCISADENIFH